jgi:hypothetical protein
MARRVPGTWQEYRNAHPHRQSGNAMARCDSIGENMKYKLAEHRDYDGFGTTTEYFINTPDGRMSVRMPNFISQSEHDKRLQAILKALNTK